MADHPVRIPCMTFNTWLLIGAIAIIAVSVFWGSTARNSEENRLLFIFEVLLSLFTWWD